MTWYVYILSCRDGTLYTGITNDLDRRIRAHNDGKGAKYTRSRGPVKVVYREIYESRSMAQKREYKIKQWTRTTKLRLVQSAR